MNIFGRYLQAVICWKDEVKAVSRRYSNGSLFQKTFYTHVESIWRHEMRDVVDSNINRQHNQNISATQPRSAYNFIPCV